MQECVAGKAEQDEKKITVSSYWYAYCKIGDSDRHLLSDLLSSGKQRHCILFPSGGAVVYPDLCGKQPKECTAETDKMCIRDRALACGKEPSVLMNPILLKPVTDMGSQVIVMGEVQGNQKAMEYFRHKKEYLPEIRKAYDNLAEQNDVIVIEGAGSPAEINLKQDDIVNMGMAELADCLLYTSRCV